MSLFETQDEPEAIKITRAWLETTTKEKTVIQNICSLGRSANNHLVLLGERVSRNHALVQTQGMNELWLSDLGSVNGTYLNGQRITRATRVYDGDSIGLGSHRLTVRQPGGPIRSRSEYSMAEMTISDVQTENCWLLLVQSNATDDVTSAPTRPGRTGSWLDRSHALVEERAGKINRYTDQGFLAYWRDRPEARVQVAQALRGLLTFQSSNSTSFRMALHYAQIQIGHPAGAQEILSGSAVNFTFRVERLAHWLKTSNLITEVAQALLQSILQLSFVGRHPLKGIEGDHAFFQIPPLGS